MPTESPDAREEKRREELLDVLRVHLTPPREPDYWEKARRLLRSHDDETLEEAAKCCDAEADACAAEAVRFDGWGGFEDASRSRHAAGAARRCAAALRARAQKKEPGDG